ncbi:MAG: hypothetical protein GY853_13185 [PVC group bacterium]|nr:hypothetical protein [PVC group bacterium]
MKNEDEIRQIVKDEIERYFWGLDIYQKFNNIIYERTGYFTSEQFLDDVVDRIKRKQI